MHPFIVVTAHKYLPLRDLKDRRAALLPLCRAAHLKGSIILSPEGIALQLGGERDRVQEILQTLRTWPGLADLPARVSAAEHQSFIRMTVRIKHELVASGLADIDASAASAIAPKVLAARLDRGQPVLLLDARNAYEWRKGSFATAIKLDIEHFHEFAQRVLASIPESPAPIVVFCSTGIRSQKAAALLARAGLPVLGYLDGGILGYFEQCGDQHYMGDCAQFDPHAVLSPESPQAQWTECLRCKHPLTPEDREHARYRVGEACPYCNSPPPEEVSAQIAARNAQIDALIQPLPGSSPQDHGRPLSIPADCDGLTLLEAVCRIVTHIPELYWRERCDRGLLLDPEGEPAEPERRVHAGERYLHRFPGVIEPEVDMRIEILHEDEALIVLNKPAPLPMHAGGRYMRNTLKHVLDALYQPQQPRPAHRLDANTTGVVIAARTQFFAGKLQTQFARGQVEQLYLARVHGWPDLDDFACDASISVDAGHAGSRVTDEAGLPARTLFRVLRRLPDGTSLLEARPLTGRTNQIRVHLWHLGLPIVGDPVYLRGNELGDAQTLPLGAAPLCLHASRIRFRHPLRKTLCEFTAPPPAWIVAAEASADQRFDSIIVPST